MTIDVSSSSEPGSAIRVATPGFCRYVSSSRSRPSQLAIRRSYAGLAVTQVDGWTAVGRGGSGV